MTFYTSKANDPTATVKYDWFQLVLGILLIFSGVTIFLLTLNSGTIRESPDRLTGSITLVVSGLFVSLRALGVALYTGVESSNSKELKATTATAAVAAATAAEAAAEAAAKLAETEGEVARLHKELAAVRAITVT